MGSSPLRGIELAWAWSPLSSYCKADLGVPYQIRGAGATAMSLLLLLHFAYSQTS